VDGAGAALGLKQRLGEAGVRWVRDAQVHVIVGQCPEMKGEQNTHGGIELSLKGSYAVVGFWNEGGAETERGVLITIEPFRSHGSVDRNAKFAFWQNWEGLDIVVTRTTRQRRPGKKTKYQRVTGRLTATPAENGWKIGRDSFGEWIEREEAQNRDEAPPPGREGPLLTEDALARVIRPFLELAESLLMRSVAEAERHWRTPNACATLDWKPDADRLVLNPGDTRTIEGRVVPRGGGLDGYSTWPTDPKQFVGKVREALTASSGPGRPMKLVVVAAKPVRNDTVRFRWRIPSTIGVVESEWTARAGLPTRWEGTFAGTGNSDPFIQFQGTITLVKDERYSSDESFVYAVERAKFTVTARHVACDTGQSWTDTVSVGRQKVPGGSSLEIHVRPTPGKGHYYQVGVGFEGPAYEVPNPCRLTPDPTDTWTYTPSAWFGSLGDVNSTNPNFTNGSTIKGSSWIKGNKHGETWELHAAG